MYNTVKSTTPCFMDEIRIARPGIALECKFDDFDESIIIHHDYMAWADDDDFCEALVTLLDKYYTTHHFHAISVCYSYKEWRTMLGKLARDKVTGFEGIVVGHAKHLTGCDTYGLQPKVDSDGKVQDAQWFDEGRIEILGDGIAPASVQAVKNGAGCNPTSSRQNPR